MKHGIGLRRSGRALLIVTLTGIFGGGALAQKPVAPEPPKEKPDAPKKPAPPVKIDPVKPIPPAAPSVEELNKKGFALLDEKKYTEAIDQFNQVVKADRKNIQGFTGLGYAYLLLKRYPESITSYRTALSQNPQNPQLHSFLAAALLESDKSAESRAEYERAVDLAPSELSYRIGIGETYRRAKDYAKAREAYLVALGYGPDNVEVHNALGDLNLEDKRYDDALEEFSAAQRIDPESVGAKLGARVRSFRPETPCGSGSAGAAGHHEISRANVRLQCACRRARCGGQTRGSDSGLPEGAEIDADGSDGVGQFRLGAVQRRKVSGRLDQQPKSAGIGFDAGLCAPEYRADLRRS